MLKRALLASTFLAGLTINSWAQTSTAQMGITKQETYPRLWTLDPTNTWIPLAQMDPTTHNISMYSSLGFSFNAATLKGDAYWGWNDATYNSGGAILTSVARACSFADVNKIVISAGGGASGAPYHGKVTSCGGTYIYNLDTQFGWTPPVATSWAIGTDNSAALSVAMGGGSGTSQCLYLPAGNYLLDAVSVKMSNNCMRGQGVLTSRISPAANIGNYGTTFYLASSTVSPFTTTYMTTIEGVNFFWPGQFATSPSSVPFAYPPLLSPLAGNPSSDLYFSNNAVINAYDVFKQALTDGALGNLRMQNNILDAWHSVWDIAHVGEEMDTGSNNINTGAYGFIATAQSNAFKKWGLQNGSMMIVEGSGVAGGNCSGPSNVLGQNIHNNIINGYSSVIHVSTGWLDEFHISDNDLNGNIQTLQVDASGVIRGGDFKGLTLSPGNIWNTFGLPVPTVPAFNILATCANTNTTELNIHGRITNSHQAGAIYIGGNNTAVVNLSGEMGLMALSTPALTASTYFAIIDNPNAKVNVSGAWLWNKEQVSSGTINPAFYNGFLIKQAKSFNLSASIADTWNSVVDLSQQTTNARISISTLVTTGTTGTDAVILPATCATNTNMMANTFDKQNRYCGHNFSEAFAVQGDQPGFQFFGEPGLQGPDSRIWDFFEQASSGDLLFRSLPDSYATSQVLMSFNRNGTWNSSAVEFKVPVQFDQPLTGNLDMAGHVKAGLAVISGAPNPTISWQATGTQPTDQHNWDLYMDNLGDLFLRSINDTYAANSNYVEFVRGSGYSLTGGLMQVNVPINTSSYQAAGIPGFTGTKTAGSCVFTISGGIITNVTGC